VSGPVNLEDAAKKAGDLIVDNVKTALKGGWDKLDSKDRANIARTALELGKLHAQGTLGGGVNPQRMVVLTATVKNWRVVGMIEAREVQSAFWQGVKEAGKILGPFLADLAAQALKGAISGAAGK
jgi:hypothetical protein